MLHLIPVALAEGTLTDMATLTDTVESAAPAVSWLDFRKLGPEKFPWWAWFIFAAVVACGLAILLTPKPHGDKPGLQYVEALKSKERKRAVWTPRMLAMGGMCMALTVVLSRIKLLTMPSGGSVTPASMLPLLLFAYIYGVGPGVILGALYGVLDYLFGGWFLSVWQVLLDYPVAFGLLGLAGLFSGRKNDRVFFPLGVIVGLLGRYIAAVLAGVVFWSEGRSGLEAWTYSLAYNGTYMGLECVLCVVLALIMGNRLLKEIRKNS